MTDMTVASTILQQLGGKRFVVMTGAKNFVGGENFLSFQIKGKGKKGSVNKFKVTLTGTDLYNVEAFYVKAPNFKVVDSAEGLYFDQLQETFTEMTGLYTHF